MTDEFVKHDFHLVLASSLKTDVVYISKNDAPEQPLVSRLEMNAVFILQNVSIRKHDTPDQPLASRLETNAVFIFRNNATAL